MFNAQLDNKLKTREKSLKETINKSIQQGRKNGDDNLLQLAAQRKKKLERVGNEKNANGFRFKLNRDRAGFHFDVRDGAEAQQVEEAAIWDIPHPLQSINSNNLPLLSFENVSFAYKKDNPILVNVTFSIRNKERLVFIGRNGCGKSTLMKLLDQSITPSSGNIKQEPLVKIGSLMQDSIDKLREVYTRDLTPIHLIAKQDEILADKHALAISESKSITEEDIRKHLSRLFILLLLFEQCL